MEDLFKEGQEKNVPDLRKNLDFLVFVIWNIVDFEAFLYRCTTLGGSLSYSASVMAPPAP